MKLFSQLLMMIFHNNYYFFQKKKKKYIYIYMYIFFYCYKILLSNNYDIYSMYNGMKMI